MALMWEWSWIGKGVNQSGDGTGTTLNLSKLQIANNAQNNDTYGIELTLTDELGAYVTTSKKLTPSSLLSRHRLPLRVCQVQQAGLQSPDICEELTRPSMPIFSGNSVQRVTLLFEV